MTPTSPDSNPKTAIGIKKPRMETIPSSSLVALGVQMGHGADKYGAFNWRDEAVSISTYIGAMRRHIAAYADGEDLDVDSPYGSTHVAAIMACAAILIDAREFGNLKDDRPLPAPTGETIRFFEEHGSLPDRKAQVPQSEGPPPVYVCEHGYTEPHTPTIDGQECYPGLREALTVPGTVTDVPRPAMSQRYALYEDPLDG